MKLSEYIAELHRTMDCIGDLRVVVDQSPGGYVTRYCDPDCRFDVISVKPVEDTELLVEVDVYEDGEEEVIILP